MNLVFEDELRPGKGADLADKVLESAKAGEELSPFHEEIHSLSQEESLQFAKHLAYDNGKPTANQSSDSSLHIDAHTDKETGMLVDIDIVERKQVDGEDKSTRTDIYTPGEKGEHFDKLQQRKADVFPYHHLEYLMDAYDTFTHKRMLQGENTSEVDFTDSHYKIVRKMMEEHLANHPNKQALLKTFDTPYGKGPVDTKYDPVDSIDSMRSRDVNLDKIPQDMKAQIDDLREQVKWLRRLVDGR